jgi:hypothetical protein
MITETTTEAIYDKLKGLLSKTVPDFELRMKAELAAEINQLKLEKNAVILGHNYMEPALSIRFQIMSEIHLNSVAKPHRAIRHHRFLRGQVHGGNCKNLESDEESSCAL